MRLGMTKNPWVSLFLCRFIQGPVRTLYGVHIIYHVAVSDCEMVQAGEFFAVGRFISRYDNDRVFSVNGVLSAANQTQPFFLLFAQCLPHQFLGFGLAYRLRIRVYYIAIIVYQIAPAVPRGKCAGKVNDPVVSVPGGASLVVQR